LLPASYTRLNRKLKKMRLAHVVSLALTSLCSFLEPVHPFVPQGLPRSQRRNPWDLKSVSVSVSELEKDLTPAEKSITSVVRKCGDSVAFVTSVWPGMNVPNRRGGNTQPKQDNNTLPRGTSLGSGSGFLVSPGYLCTNYHVIERAYSIQKSYDDFETMVDQIAGNATEFLPSDLVNNTQSCLLKSIASEKLPEVYVRINSATKFQKCRIVDVKPDLDLAVLKIESPDGTTEDSTVSFGSSSDLLVGQTVVAIGNPFGLDNTVTTGVVSAVNREFRAGGARTPALRPIRNCIQTDAAINPGNSGGPLLNLKGEVVGINTAIITTSGSNAGIGFAVPSDQLSSLVDRMIRRDRIEKGERPDGGWLGVSIVKQSSTNSTIGRKNWVKDVVADSPASEGGIRPIRILETSVIEWGDAIVAVGGNDVTNFEELLAELVDRAKGEKVALTLEDVGGERRVVYVTLTQKPV
jgi:S1-C subfamily serine protease